MTDKTLPRWSVFVGDGQGGQKFYVPVLLHVHAPAEDIEVRATETGSSYVYVSTDSVSDALAKAKAVIQ